MRPGTRHVVVRSYGALSDSLAVITRLANSANIWRFRTCGRLSVENTLLQRLTPDLEPMAPALRQPVPKAHAVVRQRPLARHGHVPAGDQADIRDGLVRGTTGASGDQDRAAGGPAGDTVEARGLEGVGQAHRRQDGGEPPRQPRLPRPRRAEHQEIWGRTPALPSALLAPLEKLTDRPANLLFKLWQGNGVHPCPRPPLRW